MRKKSPLGLREVDDNQPFPASCLFCAARSRSRQSSGAQTRPPRSGCYNRFGFFFVARKNSSKGIHTQEEAISVRGETTPSSSSHLSVCLPRARSDRDAAAGTNGSPRTRCPPDPSRSQSRHCLCVHWGHDVGCDTSGITSFLGFFTPGAGAATSSATCPCPLSRQTSSYAASEAETDGCHHPSLPVCHSNMTGTCQVVKVPDGVTLHLSTAAISYLAVESNCSKVLFLPAD